MSGYYTSNNPQNMATGGSFTRSQNTELVCTCATGSSAGPSQLYICPIHPRQQAIMPRRAADPASWGSCELAYPTPQYPHNTLAAMNSNLYQNPPGSRASSLADMSIQASSSTASHYPAAQYYHGPAATNFGPQTSPRTYVPFMQPTAAVPQAFANGLADSSEPDLAENASATSLWHAEEPRPAQDCEQHDDRRRFPCLHPECGRKFVSEYTLRVHMEAHKAKPRVRYPCTAGCTESFSRQHDRLRHEVSQHGKVCEFVCEDCGGFFSTKKTVNNHKCHVASGKVRWAK
ncbi:hypothetical protein HWV62_9341 [Athelia sp. TMB]|nr:hypothetical protein HWV62_9341 [Athelia sp. TMB]